MSGQGLVGIASGIVDAFNEGDWDRTVAPLAADSVYNELGTQRSLKGPTVTTTSAIRSHQSKVSSNRVNRATPRVARKVCKTWPPICRRNWNKKS